MAEGGRYLLKALVGMIGVAEFGELEARTWLEQPPPRHCSAHPVGVVVIAVTAQPRSSSISERPIWTLSALDAAAGVFNLQNTLEHLYYTFLRRGSDNGTSIGCIAKVEL